MPNASEKARDEILAHQVSLARLEQGQRIELRRVLKDLEAEIVAQIAKSDPTSQRRLGAMLSQTRQTIADTYKKISGDNRKGLAVVAKVQGAVASSALSAALSVPIRSVALTEAAIQAMLDKPVVLGAPAASWWSRQSVNLQDRFSRQMQIGFAAGDGIDRLAQRVRGTRANGYTDGLMQVTRTQADGLVRTSIQSVANQARLLAYEDFAEVADEIVWISTLDGRTSQICKSLSGLRWSFPEYKPIGHSKSFPGAIAHFNCVAEGQSADAHGQKILRGFAREYRGTLITIETARGKKLTVTPNHPILTSKGFVGAGDLCEGDDVISELIPINALGPVCQHLDTEQGPALIEEITGALQKSRDFVSVSVVIAGIDFHGDGEDGQVAIVSSHRDLFSENDSSIDHEGMEPRLLRADEILSFGTTRGMVNSAFLRVPRPFAAGIEPLALGGFGGGLPGEGHSLMLVSDGMASGANPCVEGARFTADILTDGEPIAAGNIPRDGSGLRFGAVASAASGLNARRLQATVEPAARESELARKLIGGHFGTVEREQVVRVVRFFGSVRVHNLETAENFYSAQGIVTGNCRSTQILVPKNYDELVKEKSDLFKGKTYEAAFGSSLKKQGLSPAEVATAKSAQRSSMDGEVPRDITFDEWLGTKDDAFLEKTLGKGVAKLWKDGKITVSDLTDKHLRPLSLVELTALAGLAVAATTGAGVRTAQVEIAKAQASGSPELKQSIKALSGLVPDVNLLEAAKAQEAAVLLERAKAKALIEEIRIQARKNAVLAPSRFLKLPKGSLKPEGPPAAVRLAADRDATRASERLLGLSARDLATALQGRLGAEKIASMALEYIPANVGLGEPRLIVKVYGDNWFISHRIDEKNPSKIHLDMFMIGQARQNAGLSKNILKGWLDVYESAGIKSISLTANIDVGGYAWARYGFLPTAQGWRELADGILKAGKWPAELQAILKSQNPRALRALAAHPLGKKALIGTAWDGVLDLEDEVGYAFFRNYLNR